MKKGITFAWNGRKAAANPKKHDEITFEQAAEAFFDPFFKVVDGEYYRLQHEEVKNCTYQNHVFRARPYSPWIVSEFIFIFGNTFLL
ncbi:hypothetical protein [Methylicorpusculum sp.]|uniref:hypothetical protein n=1 Tax=Methylicorpusculum sp. TaxID=2713644 RepID=UPI00272FFC8C|nr:hypothetical protein [Methylicorpusculum sp.]MDP2180726.1 hypothetical protein [Methylicorpusculum sp.]MDZ4149625.1 hypothetical protein [Methylicorpusculum sp.]